MPTVTGNNFYVDKHDLHFRTGTTNVATINYDTSDESISLNVAGTGAINIGDAGGDIFIGDGTTQSDIIFEQNGAIRGLTNKTLTLGQTDSNVTIAAQNFTISGTSVITDMSGRLKVQTIEATDNTAAGWAGTDNQYGTIYMSDEGRGLLGNMGGGYARPLISSSSNAITIGSEGTSAIRNIKYHAGNGAATADSEHNFYTSGNLRMHIAKNGRIGIGVADPDYTLDIGGDIGIGDYAMMKSTSQYMGMIGFNRNGNNGAIYNNSYGAFQLQNNNGLLELQCYNSAGGAQAIHGFTSAGNVGLGTTIPNQLLHVDGKTQLGTNGFSEGGLLINYASLSETKGGAATLLGNAVYAGTTNNTFRRTKGDAGNYIRMTYSQGIAFHTNVTGNTSDDYPIADHEQMRIDLSGNVGVGTDNPSAKLHVYDSAGPAIKFERNSNSNLQFTFGTSNTSIIGAGELQFRANGGTSNKFVINNSLITASADLYVNANVGIGTNAPSYELDVVGTTRSTYYIGGAYFEENASSSKIKFYPNGTVLVMDEDGELKPCEKENDTLVFGVSKRDFEQPIVLGAEPILVTGPIKVGDYIVTSNKQGHGQAMKEQNLGTIIAQAMENGDGESYNIKAMIRKM